MKFLLTTTISLLISVLVYSQEPDSNWTVWNNSSLPDTSRFKALDEFIDKVIRVNMDSAETLANIELSSARDKKNRKFEASALRWLTRIYNQQGNPIKSLSVAEEAKEIAAAIGDKHLLAKVYNDMGITYYRMNNYSLAIENYLESARLNEEVGDKAGVGGRYNNIGMCFARIEDDERALEYYLKSLKIAEEIGNEESLVSINISLGNLYMEDEADKALEHYRKVLDSKLENLDKRNVVVANHNIAFTLWKFKHDPKSAITYFEKAIALKQEMGFNSRMGNEYTGMGGCLSELGEYKEAFGWCKKALESALETQSLDIERDACGCLYKAFKGLGRIDSALKYHERVEILNDTLLSIDREREINRKELSYQFEKKALTDSLAFANREAILKEQTTKQRMGLAGAGVGLLLLLALAFSIYKGKKRSDELLLNILPEETAKELKQKGYTDAKHYDEVTVLFTDFKEFTQIAEKLTAQDLVREINACFSAFDEICEKYKIEKIKTIGDSYMAAAGLPVPQKTGTNEAVKAALEMRDFMMERKKSLPLGEDLGGAFEIRIGVHTGPVVAGIVGIKKFQYDIWGDTVNTASRMESSGEVGKVNISSATYELVKDQFSCEYRGKLPVKGKGEIDMYFVNQTLG